MAESMVASTVGWAAVVGAEPTADLLVATKAIRSGLVAWLR